MPTTAWRLLALPMILMALLLAGTPDFPALQRAIANAFAPAWSPSLPAVTVAAADRDQALRPVIDLPAAVAATSQPAPPAVPARPGRGPLIPLYAATATLQALDAHSTLHAVGQGGREANAAMAGLVAHPAAFVAAKAATAAGIIYLGERLRGRSRPAAIVLMTAVNSLYATVVAHNYRTASRLSR